jgi:calcineurin-like phosphoesterase family protein
MFKAFYSDPHFWHTNIINKCGRAFNDVEEMNNALISNYNSVIGNNDIVLWVGDCFFTKNDDQYRDLLSSMNGRKILVIGNHDQSESAMAALGFDLAMREAVLSINGVVCRVSHYPYNGTPGILDKYKNRRPHKNPGEILLHGHNHSFEKVTSTRSINIGVDAWNFSPALYEDVANLVCELANEMVHHV